MAAASGTFLDHEAIVSSLRPHYEALKQVLAQRDFSPEKVEDALARVPELQLSAALGRINIEKSRMTVVIEDPQAINVLMEEEALLDKELEELECQLQALETESRQEIPGLKELPVILKEIVERNHTVEAAKLIREEITWLEQEYDHHIKSTLPQLESISILDDYFSISFDSQTGIGFLSNTPFGMSPDQKNTIDWDQTNICFSHVCYLLHFLTQTHQIRSSDYTIEVCDYPPTLQYKHTEKCRLKGPASTNKPNQLGVALCMLLAIVDEVAKNLMKKVQAVLKTKPDAAESADQKTLLETVQKTITKLALDAKIGLPFEISGKSIVRNKVSAQGMLGSVTNMFKKDKKDDSGAEISNFSNPVEWTTTLACLLTNLKYIILLSDVLQGFRVPVERLTQVDEMKANIWTKFTKDR